MFYNTWQVYLYIFGPLCTVTSIVCSSLFVRKYLLFMRTEVNVCFTKGTWHIHQLDTNRKAECLLTFSSLEKKDNPYTVISRVGMHLNFHALFGTFYGIFDRDQFYAINFLILRIKSSSQNNS